MGLAGPHIAPGRLIPANPNDLRRFPYRTAESECVKPEMILQLSEMIKDLYHKHGIRIIPRNGFLLGIMRHGGFLPVEKPDDDLGVVYSDLLGLVGEDKKIDVWKRLGEYSIKLTPDNTDWVNWKGREPGTDNRYEYFRAYIHRNTGEDGHMHAMAIYPYRDTGGYFYPRLDKMGINHEQHVSDGIRWNEEGADLRLLDTDELMTKENYADGKQMGNYFDTDLSCTMEVQFYFTTIYVPCDYEKIITSQYGNGWRNVERRGPKGSDKKKNTNFSTEKISKEENAEYLQRGPRPVCKNKGASWARAKMEEFEGY